MSPMIFLIPSGANQLAPGILALADEASDNAWIIGLITTPHKENWNTPPQFYFHSEELPQIWLDEDQSNPLAKPNLWPTPPVKFRFDIDEQIIGVSTFSGFPDDSSNLRARPNLWKLARNPYFLNSEIMDDSPPPIPGSGGINSITNITDITSIS